MSESRAMFGAVAGAIFGAVIGLAALAAADSISALYTPVAIRPTTTLGVPQTTGRMNHYAEQTIAYATANKHAEMAHSSQQLSVTQLSLVAVAFGGLMVVINAAFLSYFKRGTVSLAATTGEKDEEMGLDRRQALLGASAFVGMMAASPAQALFGFGEDANQVYANDTIAMLTEIKSVLVLDAADATKQDKIAVLRKDMNAWVAKYRRDTKFNGRASYGNLYSVINAIAGQYTNFGTKTPIPKKRAAQIVTEIAAAEQLVSKGR